MSETERGVKADLRSYYEREAELGHRSAVGPNRLRARNEFIERLKTEGRDHVVDFGAGPGIDVEGFVGAGIACVGLDLAVGNAKLAAGRGLQVIASSIAAPPLRTASFDAGWSMSTFMHVPEAQASGVARAMAMPLAAGAPLMVGLWGGARRDEISTAHIEGERRLFSMRPLGLNRELLRAAGTIEHSETWDVGPDNWEYQLFLIRARN